MAREELPYEKFIGLAEETTVEKADGRMQQGWILISTYKTSCFVDAGCICETLHYVFGIPKKEL